MDEKHKQLQAELAQIDQKLQDSAQLATPDGQRLAKRRTELIQTLERFKQYTAIAKKLADTEQLASGSDELADLAKEEMPELKRQLDAAEQELEAALHPPDPSDQKPAIIEIRAGAGGLEASLFAGELYRMYARYAESKRWHVEIISQSDSEQGGFKEIIFKVKGNGVYGELKYESGVHRVQRIPATESAGRIHTSTATVAVLPEAEETEVQINPAELRIDVFRSSGPGGQSVNTTDSAVRITHLPTGLVVSCQDERSQLKNRAKAMNLLRTKLLAMEIAKDQQARAGERRSQIGTGDRSEKIRTYNFPQDRLTDHRINLTLRHLGAILEGNLEELITKLNAGLDKSNLD